MLLTSTQPLHLLVMPPPCHYLKSLEWLQPLAWLRAGDRTAFQWYPGRARHTKTAQAMPAGRPGSARVTHSMSDILRWTNSERHLTG